MPPDPPAIVRWPGCWAGYAAGAQLGRAGKPQWLYQTAGRQCVHPLPSVPAFVPGGLAVAEYRAGRIRTRAGLSLSTESRFGWLVAGRPDYRAGHGQTAGRRLAQSGCSWRLHTAVARTDG